MNMYGLLKQSSVNQASNCQLVKIDLVLWIHLINKLKTVSAAKIAKCEIIFVFIATLTVFGGL